MKKKIIQIHPNRIGIEIQYDDDDNGDEMSDDSLNRMARIATGFNEDHPMANSSDSDDTDDETAMRDNLHPHSHQHQHQSHLHLTDAQTTIVHEPEPDHDPDSIPASASASRSGTGSSSDSEGSPTPNMAIEIGTPTVLVASGSVVVHDSDTTEQDQEQDVEDADHEMRDIQMSKPRYGAQISHSLTYTQTEYDGLPNIDMMRSPSSMSTSSILSGTHTGNRSVVSSVDKSSISLHQIDRLAFLQKILRNSMNKHRKDVEDKEANKAMERERIKKERELQEVHRTSNIKVIDDNTIAINIGISKAINDAPIPEGNEEEYGVNVGDGHYENQSSPDNGTDTDPETAMMDFNTPTSNGGDKGFVLKLEDLESDGVEERGRRG